MARSEPAGPWIIGAGPDLLWFWGSAAISLGAGALALGRPALALPIFCLWLLLADGPHFWATWTRSLWDPEERAQRGEVIRRAWSTFALGPVAWGLSTLTRSEAPWVAFLFFCALWGYHHAVRQSYGLWSLYARRASLTAGERRIDEVFLYGSLWGIFAWFAVAHPLNAAEIGAPLPRWIPGGLLYLWGAWMAGYALVLVARRLRVRPVTPGLFALLPCAGLYGVGFIAVGLREPVIPGFTNLEQAMAVLAITNGLQHGLQYIGLVSWAGKNRYPQGGASLAARLSARPAWGWLFGVALSVPYVALNLSRAAAPGVHPQSEWLVRASLCLYWGFVLHHYYLDQHIWRPHRDPALRADLRLG